MVISRDLNHRSPTDRCFVSLTALSVPTVNPSWMFPELINQNEMFWSHSSAYSEAKEKNGCAGGNTILSGTVEFYWSAQPLPNSSSLTS